MQLLLEMSLLEHYSANLANFVIVSYFAHNKLILLKILLSAWKRKSWFRLKCNNCNFESKSKLLTRFHIGKLIAYMQMHMKLTKNSSSKCNVTFCKAYNITYSFNCNLGQMKHLSQTSNSSSHS